MSGELQGNAGGLGDCGIVGGVGEQDAGAGAVQMDAIERRRQVSVLGRVAGGNADDLRSVRIGLGYRALGVLEGSTVFWSGLASTLTMIA
jgi:hypothetical protein